MQWWPHECPTCGRIKCTLTLTLSIILLSPTTCTESRGHPRVELAFLISLWSLLLSTVEMLLALSDYSIENGWCHHRFVEICQDWLLHSKGPDPHQQIQSALTFLVCSYSVISPIQFIVQVNYQVLVRCHHLIVCSLDVHLINKLSVGSQRAEMDNMKALEREVEMKMKQ